MKKSHDICENALFGVSIQNTMIIIGHQLTLHVYTLTVTICLQCIHICVFFLGTAWKNEGKMEHGSQPLSIISEIKLYFYWIKMCTHGTGLHSYMSSYCRLVACNGRLVQDDMSFPPFYINWSTTRWPRLPWQPGLRRDAAILINPGLPCEVQFSNFNRTVTRSLVMAKMIREILTGHAVLQ